MHKDIRALTQAHPDLAVCTHDIQSAFDVWAGTYRRGGKALVCGNGGSAADAEHIVGELMKGYLLQRPMPHDVRASLLAADPETGAYLADHLQGALPAISLVSQVSLITAFANDVAPDMIFAQQVFGYGAPGDVLVAISTSGNSTNILHALRVARVRGLHTIGLTGITGGRMMALCDVAICVPRDGAAPVQELHLPVYHTLCSMLETAFFER